MILTATSHTVQHVWSTAVLVRELRVRSLIRESPTRTRPDGQPHTQLPAEDLVHDISSLRGEILGAMQQLYGRATESGPRVRPVTGVDIVAEVWRAGYELPMMASEGDWLCWIVLEASVPQHEESGVIAVYDPRAGSGMTASPGLPWGRQLSLRPVQGLMAVVPGWLTSAVQPIEDNQVVTVLRASSTH
ncbi:hypothetical protein [Streptomyces sp. AC154]|uniref:hypothetical protein n=1 Tax=Streptomyces sp. AC154 TaxID=3143184 RepID=UPI003F7F550F